jgi:hypothetical protein
MARRPEDDSDEGHPTPETLSELLFSFSSPAARKQLEEYRIAFEAIYGPTDLTRRYTCTWPRWQQEWLMEHDHKSWFDGLPPFLKAYLRGKMDLAAEEGKLDDMPDNYIKLYVSKQMTLDHEKRSR